MTSSVHKYIFGEAGNRKWHVFYICLRSNVDLFRKAVIILIARVFSVLFCFVLFRSTFDLIMPESNKKHVVVVGGGLVSK